MPARILVVDDDAAILDVVVEVLQDAGYAVLTATDGQQAVETAPVAQPQLIVMDLMMPVLDGPAAIRQLKQHPETHDIPIIAASACPPPADFPQAVPADLFLPKPFDLSALLEAVAQLLWDWGCSMSPQRPVAPA